MLKILENVSAKGFLPVLSSWEKQPGFQATGFNSNANPRCSSPSMMLPSFVFFHSHCRGKLMSVKSPPASSDTLLFYSCCVPEALRPLKAPRMEDDQLLSFTSVAGSFYHSIPVFLWMIVNVL